MIRPLEGSLVVEFGQLIAAPSAGMILAGYGADVIKVEPPGGDRGRALLSGPVDGQLTPVAVAFNQGKRSIVLDLKRPRALDVARMLVERADVVIESSRPGAMERLGLGFADVRCSNPRVVYASVSAFGRTGPEGSRGGVDMVVQAESGLMSVTGEMGGRPLKVGFQVVDAVTGHVLAQSILAALLQRQRTGVGEHVEVSLLETALSMQAGPLSEYLATGRTPQRWGNSAPQTAPADLFETADEPIVMTGYLEPQWRRLCEILGRSELAADARFDSRLNRVVNRRELFDELQAEFLRHPSQRWLDVLGAAGIPAGRVKTYADVVESAQVVERGDIVTISGHDGVDHRAVRLPPRFGDKPCDPRGAPPLAGQHTVEILEMVGLDPSAVEEMVGSGAAEVHRP